MHSKEISFKGAFGDQLSASLELPDNKDIKTFALFAHCFTCSKDLRPITDICETLTKQGIAVFRFDFTGLGESEGEFEDTNFSSNIEDLVKASSYLRNHYQAPEILIGHSLGGAAVIQAAHRIDECKAVATIGAPADPEHVKKNFAAQLEVIESKGEATVILAGRDFTIKKQFIDDLEISRMDIRLKNLDRALMIFHSPVDQRVGIKNAEQIYRMARHPKSFVSLDDADHLLMDEKDSIYVGKVLASWAGRYF